MLNDTFFQKPATKLAKDLLGKVIRSKYKHHWLSAKIIETEAYETIDKASHASLGRTPSREALYMPPGTIYMYYSRGSDSMNISCGQPGDAVLIKSCVYFSDLMTDPKAFEIMQELNPINGRPRTKERLLSGQTLLCKALHITVKDWNKQTFDSTRLYIEDVGYAPSKIIATTRLGIPDGRDGHLPYRFIDAQYESCATKKGTKPSQIIN